MEDTLYGQHSRNTLIVIAAGCTVAGLLVGLFAIPADAMTLPQRAGLGLAMGVWGFYCVYGWRVLFSEELEQED
ncbi:MAG: hypothetical protein KC912_17380 [Proteobacteria bacterium]|nr:hypothetical protein [Pseudomonadota bacterium]